MKDDAQMFVRRIKAEERAIEKQRYCCRFTHNKKYVIDTSLSIVGIKISHK